MKLPIVQTYPWREAKGHSLSYVGCEVLGHKPTNNCNEIYSVRQKPSYFNDYCKRNAFRNSVSDSLLLENKHGTLDKRNEAAGQCERVRYSTDIRNLEMLLNYSIHTSTIHCDYNSHGDHNATRSESYFESENEILISEKSRRNAAVMTETFWSNRNTALLKDDSCKNNINIDDSYNFFSDLRTNEPQTAD